RHVLGGQQEALARRVVGHVLGRCHRAQPLSHVSLRGAGAGGELRGGQRPGARHSLPQPEPVARQRQRHAAPSAQVTEHPLPEPANLLLVEGHPALLPRRSYAPARARVNGRERGRSAARAARAARLWAQAMRRTMLVLSALATLVTLLSSLAVLASWLLDPA